MHHKLASPYDHETIWDKVRTHLPCIWRAFDDNGVQLPIKHAVTIIRALHLARIRSHWCAVADPKIVRFLPSFPFFFIIGNGFQRFVGQTSITSIFSKIQLCVYLCLYVYVCVYLFVCMCICM